MTFSITHKITIGCIAMMAFAAAQAPPAAPAKKFKDDKEQTEAIAANTEKDPKAQIEKLDLWKHDYPETEYAVDRTGLYFQTYGTLKDYHNQLLTAQALNAMDIPDTVRLQVLRQMFADVGQINAPSADDLAALTYAANYTIDHADDLFAAKNKPAGTTDDQWTQVKPQLVEYAKAQLDVVAQKQSAAAHNNDAIIERLKKDPTRVNLNVQLGKNILAEAKEHPEKQSDAIFHYARAAAYTGPGCLDPKTRAGMRTFVDKAYKQFHGTAEGEDKLLATAATQPLPDGYVIKSNVEMAKEGAASEDQWRAEHPMLAQWRDVKAILVADGGDAKFASDIKDSGLPKFKGKIVSMTPALRPKTIVLSVDPEKDGASDVTLTFATPLAGKMDVGEELEFEGTAKAFTKEPYMLTLEVEKDKLTGWTGKNAPARPGAGKATKKGN